MKIKSELKYVLKGRVTIVGVGNVMKGDDGFGHILSDNIRDRVSASVISTGTTPENYIRKIRDSKPNTVLLIDAADFGGRAGDIRLLKTRDIPLYGLSTHNASLSLFISFIEEDTNASVCMLAVQPSEVHMNTPLSSVLDKKRIELESLFLEILPKDDSLQDDRPWTTDHRPETTKDVNNPYNKRT